ncbi:uncharacterized protein LOC117652814 [Thrips palmi]|uniref:Uncharacterized protein LOC117652814 n=1 Tax=Thrips palmi TaxID=161013 RepID=A0A6P9A8I2_THRPL|nr:uncharacterized protein LOC117652814 [Thrips palmi]
MADAADRREARRRRILENSENRLRIISGLTKVDDSGDLTQNIKDDGLTALPVEKEADAFPTKSDVASYSSPLSYNKVSFSEEVKHFQSTSELDNHLTEPVIPPMSKSIGASLSQPQLPKSIVSTLLETRLYLVGLAIIVRLLLSSNHGYLFGDSIFVPLFTTQFVRYFGIAPYANSNSGGMINAALMLSGMSSRQINLLIKTLGFMKVFLTDFYIYFFTFMMVHVLLEISVN